MDDPAKKETQEETKKSEKNKLTEEEAEKVAAGASFRFYDREKRKPK